MKKGYYCDLDKKVSEIVKREDWQKIRKGFLGRWKKEPKKCLKELKDWVGNIKETECEKLRIAYNYLTGTGFRIGVIGTEKFIKDYRKEISEELKYRRYITKIRK